MEIKVNNEARIDKYLGENTKYSRSIIVKMIDDKLIKVNNKAINKGSYQVKINDLITLPDNYQTEVLLKPEAMPLEIIYEDEYLMVINKPSGLVVHPGNGNLDHTLVNGLLYYTNALATNTESFRPGIVHRIDKDTSGLIMVAKTNEAHEKLANCFKNHTIKRTYITLLCGVLPHDKITIDAPIGRDPKYREQMTVTSKNSKQAITHLTVLKRYQNYTLVKANLETGRTHQIRVHTKYIGYPIFNDPVYNHQVDPRYGQFLHSFAMDFIHPFTDKVMHLETPLPDYFADYLKTLP
jgi:23S rRNA pseudouridine1911/1915/1917 synthase